MTITTGLSGGRVDPPAADHPVDAAVLVGGGSVEGPAMGILGQRLGLTVRHPVVGVCVVVVDGEVDMLTAPLLDACVGEQLAAVPRHLILDLEAVRFLGTSGLDCLVQARERAEQATGMHLHLAGLVTRVVARSLEVTGLVELFNTYPCLTDALTELTDATEGRISNEQVGLLSVTGRLDETGLRQLGRGLQAQLDTDTRYLVVNLAGVSSCDYRLFEVLTRTHQLLTERRGWLRLVGIGPTVRNALDNATPSECLLVYQAADWTEDLAG